MRFTLLLCCLGLASFSLHAQEEQYEFKNYTVEDGLSQSTVYSIIQDNRGFIWAGTRDGLNRFDGFSFEIFHPNNGKVFNEKTIRALVNGYQNTLWIGTDGDGVVLFDPLVKSFSNICSMLSLNSCKSDLNVLSLAYDDSVLWAGTRGNGLIKFDLRAGKQQTYLKGETVWSLSLGENDLFAGTDTGLAKIGKQVVRTSMNTAVYALFYDEESKNLWAGTSQQGVKIFEAKGTMREQMLPGISTLDTKTINTISKNENSEIWLGTRYHGMYVYKPDGEMLRITTVVDNANSLAENSIRSLFLDRSGVMWVGTNTSGILNYSKNRFLFPHYIHAEQNGTASGNVILCFEELPNGNIIIGTERNGLKLFNPETKEFRVLNFLRETTIVSFLRDNHNQLWIGSDGEGLYKLNNRHNLDFGQAQKIKNLTNESVLSLMQLGDNEFLAGTYRGLNWIKGDSVTRRVFADMANKDSLKGDRILALQMEDDKDFWVGTYAGGLSYFNASEDKFITYQYQEGGEGSISSNRVQSIHKDSKGRLWIGTYNGLNLFDYETQTFEVFEETDGLPNGVIYGILEDEDGYLWLSTNKGISRFNPETTFFRNYTTEDGLQSNEFNGGAYFQSSTGEMYFGGINGFNAFNPDSLLQKNNIPNTAVTLFSVEGNKADLSIEKREYNFGYQDSYFLFEFVTLDFHKPEKHQFRYKLLGLGNRWINIGKRRNVNFSGLPPGTYEFVVQGTNGDGRWGQESQPIRFSITPPFWNSNLFRGVAVFLLGIILYIAYKYRTYYLLKEEKTRNRIARDLHDDLSGTLSSISFFSEAALRMQSNEEEAKRFLGMIDKSASEAKEKINDIIWAIDPSKDNWPVFLKKCKRFAADALDSKEIDYEINISDNFDNAKMELELRQNLWLIFKEMINNLVEHAGASKAWVTFVEQEKIIYLEVRDNGKGFKTDLENDGHGVRNIHQRASLINGKAKLETKPRGGTSWKLTVKA